jgi:hypothetical protein
MYKNPVENGKIPYIAQPSPGRNQSFTVPKVSPTGRLANAHLSLINSSTPFPKAAYIIPTQLHTSAKLFSPRPPAPFPSFHPQISPQLRDYPIAFASPTSI